jgi:hypothetical protein
MVCRSYRGKHEALAFAVYGFEDGTQPSAALVATDNGQLTTDEKLGCLYAS